VRNVRGKRREMRYANLLERERRWEGGGRGGEARERGGWAEEGRREGGMEGGKEGGKCFI